jgi:GTP-binding protein
VRNQVGNVRFVGSFPDALPKLDLPEIAFAGRSNVGKSSCLNKLLNTKKAARTSATPGRTQLVNLFQIGTACVFADLPGYGYAKVPGVVREQWKGMIDKYLQLREDLKMVSLLVDSRHPAQDMDGLLIDALVEMEIPTIVIATKVDKLTRNERLKAFAALSDGLGVDPDAIVPFSALDGTGREEIWDRIEDVCAAP